MGAGSGMNTLDGLFSPEKLNVYSMQTLLLIAKAAFVYR